VTPGGELFLSLTQWLLPFVWLLGLNLFVAHSVSLSTGARWVGSSAAALSPALLPSPGASNATVWGITATLLTTLAVVSAARFADLPVFRKVQTRGRLEVFLWMTLPVVLERAKTRAERIESRGASASWFFRGLRKALTCVPLLTLVHVIEGERIPWPVQSAVLILYFVLNLTAVADLTCAVCTFCGFRVQDLFITPLLSVSPRDFWSRRWNRFISRFALKHVALPLGRRFSPALVILAVFGTSGVFHEYFAWGVGGAAARHGPMMLFFLVQGSVVWFGTKLRVAMPSWAAWMTLSAPLFFIAIQPALISFGYPAAWIPKPHWLNFLP
jgi:hypothetical protein